MSDSPEKMIQYYKCEKCLHEGHDICFSCESGSLYQPKLNIGKGPERPKLKYELLGAEIGRLVDEKNQAYGDSANTSAEAFKLLYPNGIKPEQYGDMLLLVRQWDKMKRIATRKDAFGESPYKDIVGYGLLGAMKDGVANG